MGRASLFAGMCALAVTAAAAALMSGCGGNGDEAAKRECGSKELLGRALPIRVNGDPIPCSEVTEIVGGPCKVKLHDEWSCFSFQPPGPILAWFPSKEIFREHWSTSIVAERPPCAQSIVTAQAWRHAQAGSFPNERQFLADDLVRCQQLEGKNYDQVIALLGGGGTKSVDGGTTYLDYLLGDERDSFFQVDSEGLSITFDRQLRVRDASFYQS